MCPLFELTFNDVVTVDMLLKCVSDGTSPQFLLMVFVVGVVPLLLLLQVVRVITSYVLWLVVKAVNPLGR